jgi:hypothetical protein
MQCGFQPIVQLCALPSFFCNCADFVTPLQKTIKNRRPDRFTLCPTQAAQSYKSAARKAAS